VITKNHPPATAEADERNECFNCHKQTEPCACNPCGEPFNGLRHKATASHLCYPPEGGPTDDNMGRHRESANTDTEAKESSEPGSGGSSSGSEA